MAEPAARRTRSAVAFAGVYLAASMGAAAVLFVPSEGDGGGNGVFLLVWAGLYVATAWLWLRARLPLGGSGAVLLALGLWTTLTAIWSPQPASTALYGLALTSNVVFVVWARARIGLRTFLRTALAATFVLAVAGVALHVLGVEAVRYVDVHDRTTLVGTEPLRGLFNHKITAGTYATIAAVLAWYLVRGPARGVLIASLVGFVVLTGSTGALVLVPIAAAVVALLALARALRWGPGLVTVAVAVAAVLGAIAAAWLAPPLLEAVGRDGSLTGRIDLWSWGWSVALERPFVGWGFFGYAGSERAVIDAAEIPRFVNYALPHFHNAYLQGFVDLGVVGSVVGPAIALAALYVHARRGLATGDRANLATAAAIVVVLAAGLGMHAFIQYNHYPTLLLLAAFAAVRVT